MPKFRLNALRTRWRKLRRARRSVVRGVRVPVVKAFSQEMRELLREGKYEQAELELVQRHLSVHDRVLEVGTGLGVVATACARIVGSDSVVTVEANPEMLPHIEETFRLNGVSPKLIWGAVSCDAGIAKLHVNRHFWSSSRCERPGQLRTHEVPGISFRELLDQFRPSFLVMDIEGGEVQLVETGIPSCVRVALIELHEHIIGGDATAEVRNWFRQNGFHVVRDDGDRSTVLWERGDAIETNRSCH